MVQFNFNHRLICRNVSCFQYMQRRLMELKIEDDVKYFSFKESDPRAQRLYVWGCADHGALGELKVRSKKTRITHIQRPVRKQFAFTHQISDIACGYGFSLFAVKTKHKNKLYGCGINTDGQIGYHAPRRDHPVSLILSIVPIILPIKDSENTSVIKVAAGRAHSIALTDKEGAFLLGSNAYGQCARTIIPDENFSTMNNVNHIKNLDGVRITDLACGQDHSLFLTEKGEVYSCGLGVDGQTGLGHYNTECVPKRVEGIIKGEFITKIASTTDCVLVLNDKGDVFGWGNSEYHQLLRNDVLQVCSPVHIKQLNNIGKVIDIAAGSTSCIALNERGEVFVWGYGILGKGPKVTRSEIPVQIPSPLFGINQYQADSKVVKVVCGIRSMMAITSHEELFAWGKNDLGQLGLGHTNDQMFPLRVSIGGRVIKVCCGVDHSIGLCKPYI